mgnify:CR=1 FL=1
MTKAYWTTERKAHYLKLVEKELKVRKYNQKYMARKRAEGKIKHWRQYKLEKATNDTEQNK